MAADHTLSAEVSVFPAHYNGPLTTVDATVMVVTDPTIKVAALADLGPGGGGGGPTRPSTGMLYPRRV